MTSLTVTVPPVPARAIGGNSRGNHYARHSAFQAAKQDAAIVIRAAMNDAGLYGDVNWQAVTLHIVWLYSNAAHRPDPDNAISRGKAAIDAAVSVGLIANDTPDNIVRLTLDYERASRPGIRLTFTRIDEEAAA